MATSNIDVVHKVHFGLLTNVLASIYANYSARFIHIQIRKEGRRMTPKEALKGIKQAIAEHLHKQTGVSVEKHFEYIENDTEISIVEKALNELEALKKPPTVEEVCMELSKHYNEQVSYSNERHNHMFYFEKSRMGIVTLLHDRVHFIQGHFHKTNDLPPYLVDLIGRFYGGVVKQND